MEVLKIGHIDIFLDDKGDGEGKITISATDRNYSCYWGEMGGPLNEFISEISESYFAGKLLGSKGCYCFDPKRTATNIRGQIKEILPFYKYTEFQKEMRVKIREVEHLKSENDFYYWCKGFVESLDFYLLTEDDPSTMRVLKDGFNDIFNYPNGLMVKKSSDEYLWLCDLHKKIKKELIRFNNKITLVDIEEYGYAYVVEDTQEKRGAVWDKVIEWCKENEFESGEDIQSHDFVIEAPNLMSQIIDEILRPEYIDKTSS